MSRSIRKRLCIGMIVAMSAVALPASLMAGPPWISVEYPANRLDPAARGAIALVHTYHHETAAAFPLVGTAEGIVEGRRISLPLSFGRTSRDGVWAVRGEIPEEGIWVLVVTATDGAGRERASALIALGPANDEVSLVKIPRAREGNWPRPARDGDVRAMLELAAAVNAALQESRARLRPVTSGPERGVPLLFALPFGIVGWRRRQRPLTHARARAGLGVSSDPGGAARLAAELDAAPVRKVSDAPNAVPLHRLLRAGTRRDQPRSGTVDGHLRRVDPATFRHRGAPVGGRR